MNYESGLSASDVALINGRNGDGFTDGNSWWVILFLIVLLGGWGNRGFGGFGGGNSGTSVYEGYVLNNDFSQIERKLDGIANGISDSTFALNNTIVNGNAAIQQTLTQGFSGLNTGMVQQGYETRIGINGIGTQLAQCCCDLKGLVAENKYENAQNVNALNNNINSGFVSVNQANCLNTRDIISSQEAGTRAILEAIQNNRLDDLREANRRLESKNASLELAASQAAQNEYLLNSLRNGCPVNAQLVCGNQPIPVQYVAANSCNCGGCNC